MSSLVETGQLVLGNWVLLMISLHSSRVIWHFTWTLHQLLCNTLRPHSSNVTLKLCAGPTLGRPFFCWPNMLEQSWTNALSFNQYQTNIVCINYYILYIVHVRSLFYQLKFNIQYTNWGSCAWYDHYIGHLQKLQLTCTPNISTDKLTRSKGVSVRVG